MFKHLIGGKMYFGLFSALISLSLMGCGGGGGGGSAETPIIYTEITTQALITADNAEELLVGSYQGVSTYEGGSLAYGMSLESAEPQFSSLTLKATSSLREVMDRIDMSGFVSSSAARQVTESETIYGNCGGSASATINVNEVTGNFSGSITFNNFCEDGVTLGGRTSFAGNINPSTDSFTWFNMAFTNLTFRAEGKAYTMAGEMGFDFLSNTRARVTMNIRMRDDNTTKVYQLVNMVLNLTDHFSYLSATMTGRYYDPVHGYVDMTTPVPLQIYYYEDWPTTGVLMIQGRNNTAATMTFGINYSYWIQADTNGDGNADWEVVRSLTF